MPKAISSQALCTTESLHKEGSSTRTLCPYPSSHAATAAKARGSTLGWEQPNDIVSALWKHKEWSGVTT